MIPQEAVNALIAWYQSQARDLPWRSTRDPYRILVSEIMLQQTQAERVIPKYLEFVAQFPTIQSLAGAPLSEVIRAWSGLGYNRRALNLQRACQAAMERFGGQLPDTVDGLLSLPGVGPYTAGAVACFAFEQDVAFVDTNIRRVLHRLVFGPDVPTTLASERDLAALAAGSVPQGQGYEWNQALMELGATVCRARSTECLLCPVSAWCASRGQMQVAFAQALRVKHPKQIAFEQTSRYFRGRIVHLLRSAPPDGLTARELATAIDEQRALADPLWTLVYLPGLIRDGLVVSSATGALREQAPTYDGVNDGEILRFRLPD